MCSRKKPIYQVRLRRRLISISARSRVSRPRPSKANPTRRHYRDRVRLCSSTGSSCQGSRIYLRGEPRRTVLIRRFKERTPIALTKLQKVKYSISDARNCKSSRIFAQDIFRHAKAASIDPVLNQLIMAWNALDCEFRLQFPEPTPTTTIRQFLDQLDSQASMWQEMSRRRAYGLGNPGSPSKRSPYICKPNTIFFRSKSGSVRQRIEGS